MHYIWHILQTLHQVQNYSFPHGLFNRLIRTASKCFSNTHGCFLRAIWWGWEKMRSWRRRTRTSRWAPEGWREDKSLWVGCVQGEIRQTDRSELRVLALLSSRSCSSTPGRWGPSTPVTQSTANLRAAQNELHGRAWSRSAPCCFPWESCTPPVCSQLYSLRALWPSPGEELGSLALSCWFSWWCFWLQPSHWALVGRGFVHSELLYHWLCLFWRKVLFPRLACNCSPSLSFPKSIPGSIFLGPYS